MTHNPGSTASRQQDDTARRGLAFTSSIQAWAQVGRRDETTIGVENARGIDRKPRLHALDGLRGCLCMVVLIEHITILGFHSNLLVIPARIAVLGFFAMSAHVLVRSWADRQFLAFLVRRFVRLWPVFAVCVVGSAISQGVALDPYWLVWTPIVIPVDPPAWSLSVEARAMLLMPVIVWSGHGSILRTIAVLLLCAWLAGFGMWLMICCAFLIGARLSGYDFKNAFLETPLLQWLGAISYSLYLSHNEVVSKLTQYFGPTGALLSLPVALTVGWGVWRYIEKPSIAWSRQIGRRNRTIVINGGLGPQALAGPGQSPGLPKPRIVDRPI